MKYTDDNKKPREIPGRKDPDNTGPTKDPLNPNEDNPINPKKN